MMQKSGELRLVSRLLLVVWNETSKLIFYNLSGKGDMMFFCNGPEEDFTLVTSGYVYLLFIKTASQIKKSNINLIL